MKTVNLTIEQLAIIANGLDALKLAWVQSDDVDFAQDEKDRAIQSIRDVELSLKRQTGL